jgi:hypothetical protein
MPIGKGKYLMGEGQASEKPPNLDKLETAMDIMARQVGIFNARFKPVATFLTKPNAPPPPTSQALPVKNTTPPTQAITKTVQVDAGDTQKPTPPTRDPTKLTTGAPQAQPKVVAPTTNAGTPPTPAAVDKSLWIYVSNTSLPGRRRGWTAAQANWIP